MRCYLAIEEAPHCYDIRSSFDNVSLPEWIVMSSSTSKFQLPVSGCSLRGPVLPKDGGRNEEHDLSVLMTLVHTCTTFLISTFKPTTETFTTSLSGYAPQTRTQTVVATTETWHATTVQTTVVEVPSPKVIETNGRISILCPDCDLSTATSSRFVKHPQPCLPRLQMPPCLRHPQYYLHICL